MAYATEEPGRKADNLRESAVALRKPCAELLTSEVLAPARAMARVASPGRRGSEMRATSQELRCVHDARKHCAESQVASTAGYRDMLTRHRKANFAGPAM